MINLALLIGLTVSADPAVAAAASRVEPADGAALYREHCGSCHQADGGGVPFLQPALIESSRAQGPKGGVIEMILRGSDAVPAGTSEYGNLMPAFDGLSDEEIAALATYVRTHFGNSGGAVTVDDVRRNRSQPQ